MSYSKRNPEWHRMHQSRHDARIQEEARLANDIQRQVPGIKRSEALRIATRWLDRGNATPR